MRFRSRTFRCRRRGRSQPSGLLLGVIDVRRVTDGGRVREVYLHTVEEVSPRFDLDVERRLSLSEAKKFSAHLAAAIAYLERAL